MILININIRQFLVSFFCLASLSQASEICRYKDPELLDLYQMLWENKPQFGVVLNGPPPSKEVGLTPEHITAMRQFIDTYCLVITSSSQRYGDISIINPPASKLWWDLNVGNNGNRGMWARIHHKYCGRNIGFGPDVYNIYVVSLYSMSVLGKYEKPVYRPRELTKEEFQAKYAENFRIQMLENERKRSEAAEISRQQDRQYAANQAAKLKKEIEYPWRLQNGYYARNSFLLEGEIKRYESKSYLYPEESDYLSQLWQVRSKLQETKSVTYPKVKKAQSWGDWLLSFVRSPPIQYDPTFDSSRYTRLNISRPYG